MDGQRWAGGLAAAVLTVAVGCRNTDTMPDQRGLPRPDPDRPSLLDRANVFGSDKPTPPGFGVPQPTPVVVSDNQTGPVSPETEAAFAEADVDAAYGPNRSAVERDTLLDRARLRYQSALERDAGNKTVLVGLARMYAKSGDKERAADALQRAIRHHPDDHALAHKLAATYVQFADWPAATAACERALAVDPENRTYIKTLGYCQAVSGRWEEAFGTMLRVKPEAEARYFLGRILSDMQRHDEARQQMELALQADPQYSPARTHLDRLAGAAAEPAAGPVRQAGQ